MNGIYQAVLTKCSMEPVVFNVVIYWEAFYQLFGPAQVQKQSNVPFKIKIQ